MENINVIIIIYISSKIYVMNYLIAQIRKYIIVYNAYNKINNTAFLLRNNMFATFYLNRK